MKKNKIINVSEYQSVSDPVLIHQTFKVLGISFKKNPAVKPNDFKKSEFSKLTNEYLGKPWKPKKQEINKKISYPERKLISKKKKISLKDIIKKVVQWWEN
jgi:hypothetical protein